MKRNTPGRADCMWDIRKSRLTRILNSSNAFSLIELLVSMAVMMLLLVLVAQISQMTLQTSRATTSQMDGTESARKVLDSLSRDMNLMVSGPRLNAATSGLSVLGRITPGGSPELAFLTTGRGAAGSTSPRFLAVSYSATNDVVRRVHAPVDWNDTNLVDALGLAAQTPLPVGGGGSELAGGILQFGVVLLLEDGSIASLADLENPALPPPLPGWGRRVNLPGSGSWTLLQPVRYPAPAPLNAANARTASLLVAVATIDERTYRLIPPADLPLFPTPSTADPRAEWEAKLATLNSLPAPVRAAIRFHSVAIPLL